MIYIHFMKRINKKIKKSVYFVDNKLYFVSQKMTFQ